MTIITPADSHSWPIVRCFIYNPPAGSAKWCNLLKMSSSLRVNHNKMQLPCFHQLKHQFFFLSLFFFCFFMITKGARRRVCLLSSLEDLPFGPADATLMQHYCKGANVSFLTFFCRITVVPVF